MSAPTSHANAVVIGAAGVLIRGPSGAGKSALARRLVAAAEAEGRFAGLVADDRVALAACGGRLVARVPAAIEGLAELRGRGILDVPCEPAAVVRLVVDILAAEALERLPEAASLTTEILGVTLPRQPVPRDLDHAAALVFAALSDHDSVTRRSNFACAADEPVQMWAARRPADPPRRADGRREDE